MPEQCRYCGEHAVIEESVDGGREQLICIECGSLALPFGQVPKEDGLFDCDLDDDSNISTKAQGKVDDSVEGICNYCGVDLDNSDEATTCTACLEENAKSPHANVSSVSTGDANGISKPGKDSNKCISCNGTNLSQEVVGTDERLVCLDCGTVNSDSVLTTDEFISLTRTATNTETTLPRFFQQRRIQQGLKAGLSKIGLLCSKYCFGNEVKIQAEDMFRHLFYHPKVIRVKIITKEYIGAACLFIVCRRNNYPISLTHFKDNIDVFKSFLFATKHVIKIQGEQLPHMSLTNQLTSFLQEYGFSVEIISKVKDILFLFRKAWISQGRTRMGLITIATFYTYVSSDKCSKFIPLKIFCRKFKIPIPPSRLAKECERFLLKLAQSIPWLSQGRVTLKNLHLFIDDIIKYQESLFHLLYKSEDDDDDTKTLGAQTDHDPSVERPSRKRKEILMPPASKIKRPQRSECYTPVPEGINLDSTELTETEFEDEINSYILSPEEQSLVREHKMSAWKE